MMLSVHSWANVESSPLRGIAKPVARRLRRPNRAAVSRTAKALHQSVPLKSAQNTERGRGVQTGPRYDIPQAEHLFPMTETVQQLTGTGDGVNLVGALRCCRWVRLRRLCQIQC